MLAVLYTRAPSTKYPFTRGEAALRSAIIKVSERLNRYPPAGTCKGGNIERETWSVSGREFRLDVENLRGCNLME